MNTILYRWGLRTHRENPLHTFITVLDLVFTYTLLYCTARIVQQSFRNHQTDGIGMMWYMSLALNGILIISSALTLYNAFSVTIQERRRRYAKLSTFGATIEQIRRGLFAGAFLMDCAGLVFGMAIGELVLRVVNLFIPLEDPNYPTIMVQHIQDITARGTVLSLVLEFLIVLGSMAIACRRNLARLHEPPVTLKPNVQYQDKRRWRILGRMFRIGGKLSILLHKHDKKTRASFLPSLVMSIAALVILTNVFAVLRSADLMSDPVSTDSRAQPGTGIYLHTLGRKASLDNAADAFFRNPQNLEMVHHVESYQIYIPGVYCLLQTGQISRQVKAAQASHLPAWLRSATIPIYNISHTQVGDQLLTPRLVFLKDSDFRAFAASQDLQAGNGEGIWLSCVRDRSTSIPFLRGNWEHETLQLYFYSDDQRIGIGEKEEKAVTEGEQKELLDMLRVVPCKDAQDFMTRVSGMQTKTVEVKIAGVARKLDSGMEQDRQTLFWDLDRSVPTIVFSELAKPLFAPYLEKASAGSSYTTYIENRQEELVPVMTANLYSALLANKEEADGTVTKMDGYIAAHIFGEGTIYVAGDGVEIQPPRPNYEVPLRPIYADLHAGMSDWTERFRKDTLPIFFTVFILLTLFTLFTNIVNVVYANHILYQREYAMLESIGMDERQNRSLILYEGARYSLYAIFYSMLCTLAIYPVFSIALSNGMAYELLCGGKYIASPAMWTGYIFSDVLDALLKTAYACWNWISILIFLLSGLTVFVTFFLTNIVATRRMSKGDLVAILKQE